MEVEINRLNNLVRKQEADYLSINGEKARLESQMLILLEQNNQLRARASANKSATDFNYLKMENEKLKAQLEVLRSKGVDQNYVAQLEGCYQQINHLNLFIAEREGSYNELIGQVEQLRRITSQDRVSSTQLLQKQIKQETQKLNLQIEYQKLQINKLNLQINKLNTELLSKADFTKKNKKQQEQLDKLIQQNQRLQGQLTNTQNSLLVLHAANSFESQNNKKNQQKFQFPSFKGNCVFESDIQSPQESDWRIREYEWEKQRMKMESQINRLKSNLYNSQSTTDLALKQQAQKYEQLISILNTEMANLKLNLQQYNKTAQKHKPLSSIDAVNSLQKKLRKAKAQIKQLNAYKQKYLQSEINNQKYLKQIQDLKISVTSPQKTGELPMNAFQKNLSYKTQTTPNFYKTQVSQITYSRRMVESDRVTRLQNSFQNQDYQKWLVLQGKIQRLKEQNNYLRYSYRCM